MYFYFYLDSEFKTQIAIGEITDRGIKPIKDNFSTFESLAFGTELFGPLLLTEDILNRKVNINVTAIIALTSTEAKS